MDEYVGILARMHHLDVGPFADAGAELPARPSDVARTGIRAYERAYRAQKVRPDPFMEFCLGWLARNPPRHRVRPSVVVWDSGQFHHGAGRISALLDLELAHIGDPMMDLAGLRMRSTVIDYGPLDDLYRRYEDLTGDEVDLAAIAYQHFAFTITTQLAYHRGLVEPTPDSDLMTYMQWCSESNLYASRPWRVSWGSSSRRSTSPTPHRHPPPWRTGIWWTASAPSRGVTNAAPISCAPPSGWPGTFSASTRSVPPSQNATSTTWPPSSGIARPAGPSPNASWSAS
jgi:hypothetical protein